MPLLLCLDLSGLVEAKLVGSAAVLLHGRFLVVAEALQILVVSGLLLLALLILPLGFGPHILLEAANFFIVSLLGGLDRLLMARLLVLPLVGMTLLLSFKALLMLVLHLLKLVFELLLLLAAGGLLLTEVLRQLGLVTTVLVTALVLMCAQLIVELRLMPSVLVTALR